MAAVEFTTTARNLRKGDHVRIGKGQAEYRIDRILLGGTTDPSAGMVAMQATDGSGRLRSMTGAAEINRLVPTGTRTGDATPAEAAAGAPGAVAGAPGAVLVPGERYYARITRDPYDRPARDLVTVYQTVADRVDDINLFTCAPGHLGELIELLQRTRAHARKGA